MFSILTKQDNKYKRKHGEEKHVRPLESDFKGEESDSEGEKFKWDICANHKYLSRQGTFTLRWWSLILFRIIGRGYPLRVVISNWSISQEWLMLCGQYFPITNNGST